MEPLRARTLTVVMGALEAVDMAGFGGRIVCTRVVINEVIQCRDNGVCVFLWGPLFR